MNRSRQSAKPSPSTQRPAKQRIDKLNWEWTPTAKNRERFTAKTNANYKTDWNEIRQQRIDDQQKAAEDRTQQQKDGLAERERRDKDTNDRRQQLNDIRDRLATKKEEAAAETHGTAGQFSGLEVKKQH